MLHPKSFISFSCFLFISIICLLFVRFWTPSGLNKRIALWLFSESRLSLHNDRLNKRIALWLFSESRLSLHNDIYGPPTKVSKSYLDFSPMILYQTHYLNHNFLFFLRVGPPPSTFTLVLDLQLFLNPIIATQCYCMTPAIFWKPIISTAIPLDHPKSQNRSLTINACSFRSHLELHHVDVCSR